MNHDKYASNIDNNIPCAKERNINEVVVALEDISQKLFQ